ncbi:craniofacial development protein 2-like [Amphiura filiformis]|uniref:craniofacial development protein 2-like n=1 Tax=Amphiura filiformis TaxID=82378 RepID=UPI003B22745A
MSLHLSTRVKAPAMKSGPSKSPLDYANINDGLISKPVDTIPGRTKPDADKDGQGKFVQRKKPFTISTFNIRTLNSLAKKEELAHEAAHYGIDIICLQEHRICHNDSLLQEDLNGYRLVTSSAWKNQRNAATGGVGFLISPRAINSCMSIISHNERIMEISLLGNPTSTVLCCYSPHNEQPEEAVISFYQELSSTVNAIPAHNLLIIGGDFNAQLGPLDALFTPAKETNRNGNHMKDFLQEHNLIATNTRFQNRINRLWTHRRPNGQLVQLDFVLVRKKWINSIKNSRAYSSFEGVNSDHRIVSCKCQISYRKCRTSMKDPMKRIDWKKVTRDTILGEQFVVAVYNRFSSLHDELQEPNISTTYDTLVAANEEVALEMLPKKSKQSYNIAASDKVTEAPLIDFKWAAEFIQYG